MRKLFRSLLSVAVCSGLFNTLVRAEVSFEKQVKPILESACLSCHGEKKPKGDLAFHTHEALLEGEVVVAGKPEDSSLYTTTILPPDADLVMPPKPPFLSKIQSDVLKEWILDGAKWPEGVVLKQVRRINFVKDIKPLLEGFYEKEFDFSKSIVPFDLDESKLYELVNLPKDDENILPRPNKREALKDNEIDLLKNWILQGAVWPDGIELNVKDAPEFISGALPQAPKEVVDIRVKAVEQLIKQLEPTMKPYTDEIPGTAVKFEMVPIPGGEFAIGSPENEKGRKANEGPQQKVKIAPFWMAKTETTWNCYTLFMYQEEEKMVMKLRGFKPELNAVSDAVARPTTPYVEMSFGMGTDGFPAISMTQHAANTYCKWLTAKTGHYYRLPTEAEWEYACRAGTTTAYSFGDDLSKLDDYAWHDGNSNFKYQKVGTKKPNPWGLYNMHGNVSEWTVDQFIPEIYSTYKEVVSNPFQFGKSLYPRAVRGGSWMDKPEKLRAAHRIASTPDWKFQDPQLPKSIWYHTDAQFLGFRVIRPLIIPPSEEMHKYWTTEGEPD